MTDHQNKNWKSYCSEPLELVENYQQAKADNFAGWCIHHRLEIQADGTRVSVQELNYQGLYYDRPASELIFMRFRDHSSLHSAGNTYLKGKQFSEEHCKKISESLSGEKNPMYGKHRSAETRKKISEARKGMTFSEEHRQKLSASLKGKHNSAEARKKMSEAHKGKLWWNDGISNKRSKECPGPEWKRGQLKKT